MPVSEPEILRVRAGGAPWRPPVSGQQIGNVSQLLTCVVSRQSFLELRLVEIGRVLRLVHPREVTYMRNSCIKGSFFVLVTLVTAAGCSDTTTTPQTKASPLGSALAGG